MNNIYYVYIYLDPSESGEWKYKDWVFPFRPFYVGEGKGNRMFDHLKKCSLEIINVKNNIMNRLINNGYTPIIIKVYENLSKMKAEEVEISMIEHFGRVDLHTGILGNMTSGGRGGIQIKNRKGVARNGSHYRSKCVKQFSLDGRFIKKWSSASQAARALNLKSSAHITQCCRGETAKAVGFKWEYDGSLYKKKEKSTKSKPIYQYSSHGEFIKKFETTTLAQNELNLKLIHPITKNFGRPCGGFFWFREYKGLNISVFEFTKNNCGKPQNFPKPSKRFICQYDENRILLKTYNNIFSISKLLGLPYSSLEYAIKNKKIYKGYYWEFKEKI